ncbi:MAG: hypothetical protein HFJ59_00070 [Clostridia bacterium]|nr:hypothetical protein [Clostridia bacterium]
MRRNGRKEVTMIRFKGVATDGGFIFGASVFIRNIENNWKKETAFKATTYADGVMEIAIDYTESISRVAELISGMFSRISNFANLNSVILNYRNIRLHVKNTTGRKNIICMLMKAMEIPGYKDSYNDVSVDTQICQKSLPLKNPDRLNIGYEIYANYFHFDEILEGQKSLWFRNACTRKSMIIASLKDGIVTVDCKASNITISDFIRDLSKFFAPYSNFYGVKAIVAELYESYFKIWKHFEELRMEPT